MAVDTIIAALCVQRGHFHSIRGSSHGATLGHYLNPKAACGSPREAALTEDSGPSLRPPEAEVLHLPLTQGRCSHPSCRQHVRYGFWAFTLLLQQDGNALQTRWASAGSILCTSSVPLGGQQGWPERALVGPGQETQMSLQSLLGRRDAHPLINMARAHSSASPVPPQTCSASQP